MIREFRFEKGVNMENWKYIEGYEGKYMISDKGRVKSCEYKFKDSLGRKCTNKPRIIKCEYKNSRKALNKNASKRVTVGLRKNGKKKQFQISRLVAEAFIPNPENKETVNHIDGDTENNTKENLEWMTRRENVIHAYKNNLYPNVIRGMLGIREDTGFMIETRTLTDMANMLGVTTPVVRRCARKNMKKGAFLHKCKGYYLGYLDKPKRKYAGKEVVF